VKTVFFGTPEIAVPALETLTQISDVRGVVCQPDRPAGRGMQQRAPAIKSWALQHGLPLLQPEKVRDGRLRSWLADRDADVAVVLAYGRILPPDVLTTPRCGCLNLHASLLPRHRGAAPMEWAILTGDEMTGVSLMQMDEGLDTGPVFSQHSLLLAPGETADSLARRIALLAAEVLRQDLRPAVEGALTPRPQDPASVTLAPPIRHDDQLLDFTQSAMALERRIRALFPKPGAVTAVRNRRLKILAARIADESANGPPGTATVSRGRILIATGSGTLEPTRVQLEGKAAQSAADMANGRGVVNGDLLGSARMDR
jgi:methionyl-tRNA formyltransferase